MIYSLNVYMTKSGIQRVSVLFPCLANGVACLLHFLKKNELILNYVILQDDIETSFRFST